MNASTDYLAHDSKGLFVYTRDLKENLRIKLLALDGNLPPVTLEEVLNDPLRRFSDENTIGTTRDVFVSCQLYSCGAPISLETRTRYKALNHRFNWNEWLSLPIHICDLPRDAQLVLTLYEMNGPYQQIALGGTSVPIFGKNGKLRCGTHDLFVWPKTTGDGAQPSKTPGKVKSANLQMGKLSKLVKRHRSGRIRSVDWLDRLTFREVEHINEREKREMHAMFLMLDFPPISVEEKEVTLIFYEEGAEKPISCVVAPVVVKILDGEIDKLNVVERKHHILARNVRSGVSDRELKPGNAARDQLHAILSYPPDQPLTSEEQDLVWRFRFYLSQNKRALVKFLHSVNWNIPFEKQQAEKLLLSWQPVDPGDALELFTARFVKCPVIRQYAVSRLATASDDELLLYLLQLIQALRYEDDTQIKEDTLGLPRTKSHSTTRKESVNRVSPVGKNRTRIRTVSPHLIVTSKAGAKALMGFTYVQRV